MQQENFQDATPAFNLESLHYSPPGPFTSHELLGGEWGRNSRLNLGVVFPKVFLLH